MSVECWPMTLPSNTTCMMLTILNNSEKISKVTFIATTSQPKKLLEKLDTLSLKAYEQSTSK